MQDSVGPAFATRAPHRHADTIFCMASIKTYQRKSGDLSYTVVWRTGGTRAGRWCRETFDDVRQAERFQDLVNGHGQQWPPGWVKGEGFVEASTAPASDAEVPGLRPRLREAADRYIRPHANQLHQVHR